METKITHLGDNPGYTSHQRTLYKRPLPEQPKPEEAESEVPLVALTQTRSPEEDNAKAEVSNAVTYSQTQQQFLEMVEKALARMTELSLLCQDTSKADNERARFASEFTQLQNHISDIGTKKFNGASLFVSAGQALTVEVAQSKLTINSVAFNAEESKGGLANVFDPSQTQVNDCDTAAAALDRVKKGMANLETLQSTVASNIQKLNLTSEEIAVLNENLSAANLRIKDVDLARKLIEASRHKILRQPGAAMLAQAHAVPQSALRLLQ